MVNVYTKNPREYWTAVLVHAAQNSTMYRIGVGLPLLWRCGTINAEKLCLNSKFIFSLFECGICSWSMLLELSVRWSPSDSLFLCWCVFLLNSSAQTFCALHCVFSHPTTIWKRLLYEHFHVLGLHRLRARLSMKVLTLAICKW